MVWYSFAQPHGFSIISLPCLDWAWHLAAAAQRLRILRSRPPTSFVPYANSDPFGPGNPEDPSNRAITAPCARDINGNTEMLLPPPPSTDLLNIYGKPAR